MNYSKNTTHLGLRMPLSMREQLVKLAQEKDRSVASLIRRAIEKTYAIKNEELRRD